MAVSVLIVEDDQHIRELLQMYLEKEGYRVSTAADGGKGQNRVLRLGEKPPGMAKPSMLKMVYTMLTNKAVGE